MKGNTLAIVLLVVGLVVGAGAGYFLAPSGAGDVIEVIKAPLEGTTIRLGYIISSTATVEQQFPHINQILTPDLNKYLQKIDMDVDIEFLNDDATGQAAVHLEKVQGYKAMDISVFMGGEWSSQAQAALQYVNDNDMLMWSPSSTTPLLAQPDDNLFRMCPTDLVQAPAISEMLVSHGIHAIVVIMRGDSWADGIWNVFEPIYTEAGGVVIEKVRYAGESTEFSNYLSTAEGLAKTAVEQYGAEHVGIELISFEECAVIAQQAQDYPTLYSLVWFGSDGTSLVAQMIDDAPEQASHLRVHSTYAAPAESVKFTSLYDRYYNLVGLPYGYYTACRYDVGWVILETILEAQSTDAVDIIPLQADTAFNTFGASGWNRLNSDDDRYASSYQIWSYRIVDGECEAYVSGIWDFDTKQVTWYTDENGYTPPNW